MTRRKRLCRASGCSEEPYLGGLCRKHHEEKTIRTQRRDVAIHTLHTAMIEGRLPNDRTLREELLRLREWWDRACIAVQTNRGSELMPLDEAEYALEWCISLAQEIVDAERALRDGNTVGCLLAATREWVWDRFKNLEAGLRSNGLPRNTASR